VRGLPYTQTAVYVLWANTVHAEGQLTHSAIYMNKLSMTNIWSWDNCFQALALASHFPGTALEQLLVIFDHQHESGALPDYVNNLFASYSCVKPPVYGWTVKKLREKNSFFLDRAITHIFYDKVSRLTNFWLEHRQYNPWGLCYYLHGNDSGWDNASIFSGGTPLCTPDLAAFLIYQMDVLAELARELGKPDETTDWKTKADTMFTALMTLLWNGERFISRHPPGDFEPAVKSAGEPSSGTTDNTTCLINFLPLLLHERINNTVKEALYGGLLQFECRYGLTTERPDSEHYRKGGYWLGPIWAPVTQLFIDALYGAGFYETAQRISAKFLELPAHGLMAENFDGETGEGFDDNAFAWTAAAYLELGKH
jgi:glycogen debranching enzyme